MLYYKKNKESGTLIKFLGACVQNLIECIKYILDGNVRFKTVISQAAAISYDSLPISPGYCIYFCGGNCNSGF